MNRREVMKSGAAAIVAAAVPGAALADLAFAEYVETINSLARKYDATRADGTYSDAEAWREDFEDDIPPEEVWRTEMSYWESD